VTTRTLFERQLVDLQGDLVILGSMAEKALLRAMGAVESRDIDVAAGIIHDDNAIDEKRYAIEEAAIDLMARQQPMAGDLRAVACILNLSSDIERIGDHAKSIAKNAVKIADQPYIAPPAALELMCEKATNMLDRSLRAFVDRDDRAARMICDEDDAVDELHDRIYHQLVAAMIENPRIILSATYFLRISHDLERIADRATNICERVVFLVTGKMEELNVSVY
jgi:phosphate transport system protein